MKKIKVSELKPGMIYDQPVYIDPTNVLVQARQEILAKDIERLVKWGIREVETNGQLVTTDGGDAPAPAAASGPATAPATASAGSLSSEERAKLQSDYEAMRKDKYTFRNLVKETVDTLKSGTQALLENKPFDNHSVLNISQRWVEELTSKRFSILTFRSIHFGPDPVEYHAVHAAAYGVLLGITLNFSRPRLQELCFAMLLKDTGMSRVPAPIKEKAGPLNDNEWSAIKTHPLVGYKLLLKNGKVKATLANVALQHHENFDGTGYPQSIKGGQIEEVARVARIADAYTAMIEKRSYREAHLPYDAMKNMLSVQMNMFDPKLLRAFLGRLSIYPVGSLVQLSNNQIGIVISSRPDKPLRPMLRLLRDENSLPFNGLVFLDLIMENELYIIKALDARETGIDLENEI